MKYSALTRGEISRVIEGRGNARRVPVLLNFWLTPSAFGEKEPIVQDIIRDYPDDVQVIPLHIPPCMKRRRTIPPTAGATGTSPKDCAHWTRAA